MTQQQQAQVHTAGRPLLAFMLITFGGPIVMGLGITGFMGGFRLGTDSFSFILMMVFFALWFGLPASATVGLCAAASVVRYGKITLSALLLGLLLIAAGAALLLDSPEEQRILARYGLWYSLLSAIATALMAWPAKKLCDSKLPVSVKSKAMDS